MRRIEQAVERWLGTPPGLVAAASTLVGTLTYIGFLIAQSR